MRAPAIQPQPVLVNGKNRAAEALRVEIGSSPLLTLAEQALLRVEVQDGRFVFLLGDEAVGSARFSGFRPDRQARLILEHMAGYQNIRALDSTSQLVMDVEIKRLTQPATKDRPGQAVPLPPESGMLLFASGRSLVIELTNRSTLPLYFYVLDLDQDLCMAALYPYSGFGKPAKPGETVLIGYGPDLVITLSAPRGKPEGTDHLVILGSTATADVLSLGLPPLTGKYAPINDLFGTGSRLDRDLRYALSGKAPDAATPPDSKDDWTVQHRTLLVKTGL